MYSQHSLAAFQLARIDKVAIGQQHWVLLRVCLDARGVLCHHIWTVQEEGDPPEAFSLALCAEVATRLVQPLQAGVLLHSTLISHCLH